MVLGSGQLGLRWDCAQGEPAARLQRLIPHWEISEYFSVLFFCVSKAPCLSGHSDPLGFGSGAVRRSPGTQQHPQTSTAGTWLQTGISPRCGDSLGLLSKGHQEQKDSQGAAAGGQDAGSWVQVG